MYNKNKIKRWNALYVLHFLNLTLYLLLFFYKGIV